MTITETGQVMDLLQAAYPRFYSGQDAPDPRQTVAMWATMFEPYPVEIVLAAVKAHIATDTKGFPPVIGQIMAKVRQITEPPDMPEQAAWTLVHKAIQNGIYGSEEEFAKLPPDIQAVIHDPAQLKAWAIDDNFNEGVVSSNFMRSYRAKAQSAREFRAMPKDVQALATELSGKLAMPDEQGQLPEGVKSP